MANMSIVHSFTGFIRWSSTSCTASWSKSEIDKPLQSQLP